ncbi:MAG: type II toxin-antitoxin system RelE/ParE family toxin [Pseudomonadota bacterium]
MIKSFKHKGLEKLFTKGIKSGAQADHIVKLIDQLTALHTAQNIEDMNIPCWRLYELKGELKKHWSIAVNKNWRVVFRFEDGDAYVVNYEDYH